MTRGNNHRRSYIRRSLKKQVIFLSDNALYIWHQCRSRAIEAVQKGQRFSLISRSDYSVNFAAQTVRNLHRRSVPSEQICGFHVVCTDCEGFVVRNGAVRSCKHQTDGSSSNVSMESRELARRSGGSDLRINVQPPTPRSTTPDLGVGAEFNQTDDICIKDEVVGQETRASEPTKRESIPAVLRPGVRSKKSVVGHESRPATPETEKQNSVPSNIRPGIRSNKSVVDHGNRSATLGKQALVPMNLRPGIHSKNSAIHHESRPATPEKQNSVPTKVRPGIKFQNPVVRHEQDSFPTMLRPGNHSKIPVARHENSALTLKKPVSVPAILRPAMNSKPLVVGKNNQGVPLNRRGAVRVPIPVILRPGYGANNRGTQIIELGEETVRPGTSLAPKNDDPHTVNAKDGVDLSFSDSKAGRENRQYEKLVTEAILSSDESDSANRKPLRDSDAVMQDWREWSERWEISLTGRIHVENDAIDKAIHESESLLQEWRGWSEEWEQSVRRIWRLERNLQGVVLMEKEN